VRAQLQRPRIDDETSSSSASLFDCCVLCDADFVAAIDVAAEVPHEHGRVLARLAGSKIAA
jgi:hypothetical protein